MIKKKSILFVTPDYHCSFFYRDEFRKLGWKSNIYVSNYYTKKLLYSDVDILRSPSLPGFQFGLIRWLNHGLLLFWYLRNFWCYRYHVYYGRPPVFSFLEGNKGNIGLSKLFGKDFLVELFLAKFFNIKLIYLPTGCRDYESKKNFELLDEGNVCKNCGTFDRCDDHYNLLNFSRIRRFFDLNIGTCTIESTQFRHTNFKYKTIDLNLWSPLIEIPNECRLPESSKIKILHSAYIKEGRNWQGRNIKGSPYVLAAIDRLIEEGHLVEYFFIENKPSNQMRFYQAQADIIVEQLIYGWWGSTGIETMALGKPVVCYLRPAWKEFFFKTFPEYDTLPIVEANTETIYEVLKKLVVDTDFRRKKGEESRRFAEAHFDPVKNTQFFANLLEKL